MRRKCTGTATVKPETKWIYAGHTFKILSKRDPSKIEIELGYGAEYELCLIGTEFEKKYPTSPYTFIRLHDLIVNEDEYQPYDDLLDTVINKIGNEIKSESKSKLEGLYLLLRKVPVEHLVGYLPEDKQTKFESLK